MVNFKKQADGSTTAVAETEAYTTALALPADFQNARGQGTEGLDSGDVKPPRLSLAQGGTPQVKRGNPKFVEGLHEGDLFNDLTGQNYGPGPLSIIIVKFLGKSAIQFRPMLEGGGVIDFNVPLDDKRLEWTTDEKTGKGAKPVATLYYNYLVYLPDTYEVATLSMKNTSIKVAIQLNSLIKLPLNINGQLVLSPPAWARTLSLGTAMETKEANTFANFTLRPLSITDEQTRAQVGVIFESFTAKNVVVDHATDAVEPSEENVPF